MLIKQSLSLNILKKISTHFEKLSLLEKLVYLYNISAIKDHLSCTKYMINIRLDMAEKIDEELIVKIWHSHLLQNKTL